MAVAKQQMHFGRANVSYRSSSSSIMGRGTNGATVKQRSFPVIMSEGCVQCRIATPRSLWRARDSVGRSRASGGFEDEDSNKKNWRSIVQENRQCLHINPHVRAGASNKSC